MFRRSKYILFFSVAFILITLVGCGNSSNNSEESNNSDEVVTLEVWDWYADDTPSGQAQIELLQKYEENNPNVKFSRTYIPIKDLPTKILQGVAGNDLPDIMMIDNPDHQSFAASGALADLTKEIEEWGESDNYYEGAWNSTMYEGKNYGVPANSNALALFYNKDIFEEEGINEPPKTWEELKDIANRLSNSERYGFAMSAAKEEQGTFQYLPFLWQSGADLDSFGSPEAISSMELIVNLVENGSMSESIINWDQQDVLTQFQNEKVAMMINGPWQKPKLDEETPDLNYGVALLPKGKEEASVLGGENWAISALSEHKDIAWDFIKFSQEPEVLGAAREIDGKLPSRLDVAQDTNYEWFNDEKLKVFVQQLETAKPRAYGPNYPEISRIVQNAVQSSLTGNDIEKVMKESAENINTLLP